jgi:hypothetical protein
MRLNSVRAPGVSGLEGRLRSTLTPAGCSGNSKRVDLLIFLLRSSCVVLVAALWSGCDEQACVLHSECESGEVCHLGECRQACGDDVDCPIDLECASGACLVPDPNRRFVCEVDAGCPEAGPDTAVPDAAVSDALVLDAAVLDAVAADARPDVAAPDVAAADATLDGGDGALADGQISDGDVSDADASAADGDLPDGEAPDGDVPDGTAGDGAVPDGSAEDAGPDAATPDGDVEPPLLDFSGVYAVTHTVVLSSGRDYVVGDVEHTIVTLESLGGTRYRLAVFDQQGEDAFAVTELDFAAPDATHYQFEYMLSMEVAPGCRRTDLRFQRGTFSRVRMDEWALEGDEDLSAAFEGEGCNGDPFLAQFQVNWVPIPR